MELLITPWTLAVGGLVLGLLLGLYVTFTGFPVKKLESNVKPSVLVVLGSGGHTSEMLALVEGLDHDRFSKILWVYANTDKTSLPKLERERSAAKKGLLVNSNQSTRSIPRSREVGQNWLSSGVSTIFACWSAMKITFEFKPDLILLNGPGTCVPIALGGFLLKCLRWSHFPRIVFVESFCRVDSLSLTGRLLYPFVDRFVVQWSDLQGHMNGAEYLGVIF